MPYAKNSDLPKQVKGLPEDQQTKWRTIFNAAYDGTCKDKSADEREKCAFSIAWSQIDDKYKGKMLQEFSLVISKVSHNLKENAYRWSAVASDTDEDYFNDNMSLELFSDFVHRIGINEIAPQEYRTSFWSGGMPYISISHYPDLEGKAVPGSVDTVFIDGNKFKARGTFNQDKLGLACFNAICRDLYSEPRPENPVKISIAFLDFGHIHKSNNYEFVRESLDDICPECLIERIRGEYHGKIFMKGLLVHLALTRVPANERTSMEVDKAMTTRKEDAASIIGDELAEEIEKEAKIVGKSMADALVIKSEDLKAEELSDVVEKAETSKCPKCGAEMVDGKCPECDEEDDEEDEVMEEEACKKPIKKSEVEEAPTESLETVLAQQKGLLENIERMLSEVLARPASVEQAVQPAVQHELDPVLSEFKSAYDELKAQPVAVEEKLRGLQEHLENIATEVTRGMNQDVPTTPDEESKLEAGNLVEALSTAIANAMQPVASKLDLVSQQLQQLSTATKNVVESNQAIPVRRSVAPNLSMQQDILAQQMKKPQTQKSPVVNSDTPKLRSILERNFSQTRGQ